MKSLMLFFMLVVMAAGITSCSEDEPKLKGDPDIVHEGDDKWTIASVEYMLIDQSTSGQTIRNGTKANAGTFYFLSGGTTGSFEMNIEGYNKEDFFTYSFENSPSVSIWDIQQSVGTTTNQNILAVSGEKTETEMTLTGTITKQSTTGQFVLTVDMTLQKN